MAEPLEQLRYRFAAPPARRTMKNVAGSPSYPPALPRITRLMALAIKIDGVQRQRAELTDRELAYRAQVSRTRITQILNLLSLAPDIQEQLLWLPPLPKGREPITEKSLRRLAGEWHWERQRERFAPLLARRCANSEVVAHANAAATPRSTPAKTKLALIEPTATELHRIPDRAGRPRC